jgi:hypothetical protein
MSTKNKQRAKLALAELQKEMEILTKEQMNACKGGLDGLTGFSGYYDNPSGDYQQNPCKPSCVFNVFDYLDGDRHDMCHYYNETKKNLGYEPQSNGSIPTKEIATIGGYGGFIVREMSGNETFSTLTGCSVPGNNDIMMTFNTTDSNGRIIDHAVIVKGVEIQNGRRVIKYYDPTTQSTGSRYFHERSALYEVIQK